MGFFSFLEQLLALVHPVLILLIGTREGVTRSLQRTYCCATRDIWKVTRSGHALFVPMWQFATTSQYCSMEHGSQASVSIKSKWPFIFGSSHILPHNHGRGEGGCA